MALPVILARVYVCLSADVRENVKAKVKSVETQIKWGLDDRARESAYVIFIADKELLGSLLCWLTTEENK